MNLIKLASMVAGIDVYRDAEDRNLMSGLLAVDCWACKTKESIAREIPERRTLNVELETSTFVYRYDCRCGIHELELTLEHNFDDLFVSNYETLDDETEDDDND